MTGLFHAEAANRPSDAVLGGYSRSFRSRFGPWAMAAALAVYLIIILVFGAAFGVMGRSAPLLFIAPIAVLALFCIWALPDSTNAPEAWIDRYLFILAAFCVIWPNYVAVAPPGLPWITFQRLFNSLLMVVFLISLSISSQFREKVADLRNSTPVLFYGMVIFTCLQFILLPMSSRIQASFQLALNYQFAWTVPFFAAALVFQKPGRAGLMLNLFWGAGVFVALIGLWESKVQHVLWAYSLPSFLKIQDPAVQRILAVNIRSASGMYRVQSAFPSPLALSEYMALCLPILLVRLEHAKSWVTRVLAAASIPLFLFMIHLTDAHLGNIASAVVITLYGVHWAARRWMTVKDSILAPALVLSVPAGIIALFGASLVVPKVRNMMWGDGSHAASTAARVAQYSRGIPKILMNPIGYGPGQGGLTLGYSENGGMLTIDAYYLSIALEYGVIGFLVFYGMFLWTVKDLMLLSITEPDNPDLPSLKALGFTLLAFIVIKSVFSQQDNHTVVFIFLGMACALLTVRSRSRSKNKAAY
jgi:hypothetical protein